MPKRRSRSKDARFASAEEIKTRFAEQHTSLYWIAFVITADRELAEASIVDAGGLAETNNHVFHEWLNHWAHTATARVATEKVQGQIRSAAEHYEYSEYSGRGRDGLPDDQIKSLQAIDPCELHQDLDALARAILIFRGCQHASTHECALLLKVPLRSVLGAYHRALQWYDKVLAAQAEAQPTISTTNSFLFGLSRIDLDPLFRRKDQIDVVPSK